MVSKNRKKKENYPKINKLLTGKDKSYCGFCFVYGENGGVNCPLYIEKYCQFKIKNCLDGLYYEWFLYIDKSKKKEYAKRIRDKIKQVLKNMNIL